VLADFSIVSISFLIGLALLSAAVVIALVVVRSRMGWVLKSLAVVLVLALVALNAGGWVNRHFDYLPTWDELLGKRAADAASVQDVDRQQTVPEHGKVIAIDIPATTSHFSARTAQIYFPPAYFAKPRPTLGVVVLLAGEPGTPEDWTHGGNADVASDAYADRHGGRAPILVMADQNGSITADTECVGASEQYLTVDVPRFMAKRFKIATDPGQWAIGGLSEGGMCGIMLALRHPDVFQTFLDFSGLSGPRSGDDNRVGNTVQSYFGGNQAAFDAHEPLDIMRRQTFPGMGGWFEVGTDDSAPLEAQRELVPAAKHAGIETCAVEISGGEHTFQVWAVAFEKSLPWLAARLQGLPAVPCPH